MQCLSYSVWCVYKDASSEIHLRSGLLRNPGKEEEMEEEEEREGKGKGKGRRREGRGKEVGRRSKGKWRKK